jgi:tyrosinase
MSVASETTAEKQLPEPVKAVPGGHGHPAPYPEHGQSHHTTLPVTPQAHAPPNIGLYEWAARVECKKFELCCSYSVLIFLGDVPDDPEEWQVNPNYVGSHYALVGSAAEENESCRHKADSVIEGIRSS